MAGSEEIVLAGLRRELEEAETRLRRALCDARPRTERDSLGSFVRNEPPREAADRAMEGIIEARDYYDRVQEEIERYDR